MGRDRIGIMGGTFDPVHSGHIQLAAYARESAKLDRVLLVPDGVAPHKQILTDKEDRWRMLEIACCQEKGIEPCRIALDREGVSYPHETIAMLEEAYPKADFFYIIGADAMMHLSHWRSLDYLLKKCTFLVAPRASSGEGTSREALKALLEERRHLPEMGAHIQTIDMPLTDISSTLIRAVLAKGEEPRLLPPVVAEYCGVLGLYGQTARIPQGRVWMERLHADLTVKRFSHTLAVAYTARNLARNHHVDVYKAEAAALLHDCAKCLPLSEMQKICHDNALTPDALTFSSGNLLHSIAGSYLARSLYGVEDPDILRAIYCHTTGKVGMTALDMVVYLADKIEPTRAPYPTLSKVRMLAPLSLQRALLVSMEGTQAYVRHGNHPLHPQTERTIQWLRTLPENKRDEPRKAKSTSNDKGGSL
ncbi:MAG: bis(5'-nucleosyl)-tetraphosphatase (symmetrical) YqeK [Clostridia bacterium]|nr:bis(5'-nucleosyl)-tetraphosphatase (symmetrical) YqeK [Clostridia bacterium]